jgi:hypothetical protein
MHWLGYDNAIIGKFGKNTFVVTEQVNYLVYVEMKTPNYRAFCVHSRKIYSDNTRHLNCHFHYKYTTAKLIQQQRVGTNVRVRGFNAGLLARSQLHSEGPATGQIDQGFPWFSLAPEQMLSWYPNSTLHCILPIQSYQW